MVTAMPSRSTPRDKSKLNVASHDANNGRYYFLLELAMSYVARHCWWSTSESTRPLYFVLLEEDIKMVNKATAELIMC